MWQPPERIKYELPKARWPTAAESARSRLFSPIRIGPLEARQRTWVPAMVPWRATEDGAVTPEVIDWYRRFAQGRPGVLVVEATGIRDVPSGPLLRIGHDRFIDGLRTLTSVMRGGEIRRCEFTNYCEGLDQHHKQVTCKLWDHTRLGEPKVPLTADGARRLIAPDWDAGGTEDQALPRAEASRPPRPTGT